MSIQLLTACDVTDFENSWLCQQLRLKQTVCVECTVHLVSSRLPQAYRAISAGCSQTTRGGPGEIANAIVVFQGGRHLAAKMGPPETTA